SRTVDQDIGSRIQMSGIDPEECQTSHKGIGGDFECQSGKRFLYIRFSPDFLIVVGIDAHDRLLVHGGGQIAADTVQKELYPFVLEGGTTYHGNDGPVHNGGA